MADGELHSFQCPNCGAKLHPAPDAKQVTCEFCDAVSPLPHDKPSEPTAIAPDPTPGTQLGWLARVSNKLPLLIPVVIGVGLVVANIHKCTGGGAIEIYSTPILADVTGDGHEDIFVQWTAGVAEGRTCVTALIDGASRKIVWSVEVKTYCGPSTQAALAGNVAVVGAANSPSLELYQLPSGASLGRVDLDDKPTGIVGHGDLVWIDMSSIPEEVLLDVPSRKITARWTTTVRRPVQRPSWVDPPAQFDPPSVCSPPPCPNETRQRPIPPIADLNPLQVLIPDGGDAGVVVGSKARGTHLAMAAGYSLANPTVLWTHTFGAPESSPTFPQLWTAITRSTVYVQYTGAKPQRTHVAALSVATGEQLWEVAPDGDMNGLRSLAVGAAVYIPLASGIEIRDPNTGRLVATVP